MNNLSKQLNEFLSGEKLLKSMVVLPEYKSGLDSVQERLVALLDINDIKPKTQTKANTLILEDTNEFNSEDLFEQVRRKCDKDFDKAIYLLREKVIVEFCVYD